MRCVPGSGQGVTAAYTVQQRFVDPLSDAGGSFAMTRSEYHLIAQLGAGPDGVAYQARSPDGGPVELRVLCGLADPVRRGLLFRRLGRLRLLDHPAALGLRRLGLEDDPPWL